MAQELRPAGYFSVLHLPCTTIPSPSILPAHACLVKLPCTTIPSPSILLHTFTSCSSTLYHHPLTLHPPPHFHVLFIYLVPPSPHPPSSQHIHVLFIYLVPPSPHPPSSPVPSRHVHLPCTTIPSPSILLPTFTSCSSTLYHHPLTLHPPYTFTSCSSTLYHHPLTLHPPPHHLPFLVSE